MPLPLSIGPWSVLASHRGWLEEAGPITLVAFMIAALGAAMAAQWRHSLRRIHPFMPAAVFGLAFGIALLMASFDIPCVWPTPVCLVLQPLIWLLATAGFHLKLRQGESRY